MTGHGSPNQKKEGYDMSEGMRITLFLVAAALAAAAVIAQKKGWMTAWMICTTLSGSISVLYLSGVVV